MPIRSYFIQITGTDPAHPAVIASSAWSGHSLPGAGSKGLILADVTPAQHATLVADTTNVVYLPLEDAGGGLVGPNGTFGDMSAANRSALKTRLEAQGVPTQDFALGDTIKRALMRAKRRFLLRYQLGADDFTEPLDTLVSAVPAAKRARIATKLTAWGYDPSVIVGADAIREALRKLVEQEIRALRTGDES